MRLVRSGLSCNLHEVLEVLSILGCRSKSFREHASPAVLSACLVILAVNSAVGQAPVMDTVFPAGGQIEQLVEVTLGGSNLEKVQTLRCNAAGVRCELLGPNRFRLAIPANTPPGWYDLWAVGEHGVSAPRTFSLGNRVEQLEAEPNETAASANHLPLNVVIDGRIDKAGDADHFRFDAKKGQRVVIECAAERIDSRLRAVLELFDSSGRRLAVNRGYFGIDPLIDFRVPADGSYVVKIHDLTSTGSAEHIYRLEIDTGPCVAFSVPNVIQRGKGAHVTLYGWNLANAGDPAPSSAAQPDFDHVEVDIPETLAHDSWPLPVRLLPAQAVLEGFAYQFPGSHAPVFIGLTDAPVILDRLDNHSPSTAQEIPCPCEVSGQLTAGDERDWFAIQAKRGEVFYVEALGQRIQSPVDLQVSILDASGQRELALFNDEVQSSAGILATDHLDPVGRWVVPADGRYLISVQNLTGGLQTDPRRTYRLSVRREEPDFQLVAIPHRGDPAGLKVRRSGREVLDLLAFRRRGWQGVIHVSAKDLPAGLECPDIWIGPGVDRGMVVVSANQNAGAIVEELKLEGFAEGIGRRPVRSGTLVRSGTPKSWGRLVSQIPFAVAGEAPLRITADGHETLNHHLYGKIKVRHSPGGVLDVAIDIERRDIGHRAPVKLSGVGLPDLIGNQTAIVPPSEQKGYLSFYLPPTLPVGQYSLVIRAETTVPTPDQKGETVTVYSNPVTIDVQAAAFLVEVDPFAVKRAKRGETIQIGYMSQRRNGFIGKMHTELAAPGRITDVVGLRGRGETFVGQAEKGSLQIIVNDDAPLGRQPFLRLFTVGVLEDEPAYQGSSFLTLEIVE
jgi:hypothetical protein